MNTTEQAIRKDYCGDFMFNCGIFFVCGDYTVVFIVFFLYWLYCGVFCFYMWWLYCGVYYFYLRWLYCGVYCFYLW